MDLLADLQLVGMTTAAQKARPISELIEELDTGSV